MEAVAGVGAVNWRRRALRASARAGLAETRVARWVGSNGAVGEASAGWVSGSRMGEGMAKGREGINRRWK